jgi:hypothetical protein
LRTLDCVGKKFSTAQNLTFIVANNFIIDIDFLNGSKKGKILLFFQRNNLDVKSQTEAVPVLSATPEVG